MNVTEQQLNLSCAGINVDETFYCGKVWIPLFSLCLSSTSIAYLCSLP